jgi:hypothetical protein
MFLLRPLQLILCSLSLKLKPAAKCPTLRQHSLLSPLFILLFTKAAHILQPEFLLLRTFEMSTSNPLPDSALGCTALNVTATSPRGDVILCVGNPAVRLLASSSTLAASSLVFKAIFNTDSFGDHYRNNHSPREFMLPDDNPAAIQLLCYCSYDFSGYGLSLISCEWPIDYSDFRSAIRKYKFLKDSPIYRAVIRQIEKSIKPGLSIDFPSVFHGLFQLAQDLERPILQKELLKNAILGCRKRLEYSESGDTSTFCKSI